MATTLVQVDAPAVSNVLKPTAGEEACRRPVDKLRVLELFAGLGGFRLALSYAGLDVEAVAVEVNKQAIRVYAHNFGEDCVVNRDLRCLTTKWFEKQACRVWTMSPPCQPYTRQGCMRDAEDARALPLLHIISVLKEIPTPPEAIVLENVQNFERSESCQRLLEVLKLRGYSWRGFLLSPRQFGFPNARRRFYLVAKLPGWPFDHVPEVGCDAAPAADVVCPPWTELPCRTCCTSSCNAEADLWPARASASSAACSSAEASVTAAQATVFCKACERDVPAEDEDSPADEQPDEDRSLRQHRRGAMCRYDTAPLEDFLDAPCPSSASGASGASQAGSRNWLVPEATMRKEAARCFDVVRGGCRHSLCFTKAYGRFIDGTGSVYFMPERLAEPELEEAYTMKDFYGRLRYFSPEEVARLLGFKLRSPGDGERGGCGCERGCLPRCRAQASRQAGDPPAAMTTPDADCACEAFALPDAADAAFSRELWALLGNSLNPQVVALVCDICQLRDLAVNKPRSVSLPVSGPSSVADRPEGALQGPPRHGGGYSS
eukprot:TRINITY_DN110922_c0_g1_i1.p1 TRINITY_DN110922_c0_g1~~TRINITY_DN110922_c0_g1_i1.p1  ORF type:complete len:547 (-),score=128.55 TRINITY_DN110922_c0_g1_i1:69-1709(-)